MKWYEIPISTVTSLIPQERHPYSCPQVQERNIVIPKNSNNTLMCLIRWHIKGTCNTLAVTLAKIIKHSDAKHATLVDWWQKNCKMEA
jgi:hypothetical protein